MAKFEWLLSCCHFDNMRDIWIGIEIGFEVMLIELIGLLVRV